LWPRPTDDRDDAFVRADEHDACTAHPPRGDKPRDYGPSAAADL